MSELELTGHRVYIVPRGIDTSGIVSDKWPHRVIGVSPTDEECNAVADWIMKLGTDDDKVVVRPMTTLGRYKEWMR